LTVSGVPASVIDQRFSSPERSIDRFRAGKPPICHLIVNGKTPGFDAGPAQS
jgi:hypothetical protein